MNGIQYAQVGGCAFTETPSSSNGAYTVLEYVRSSDQLVVHYYKGPGSDYSEMPSYNVTMNMARTLPPDPAVMTASIVSGPAHGTLTLSSTGSFVYKPAANWSGTDSFTYKASDGASESAPAAVSITVGTGNAPPSATNDTYSTLRMRRAHDRRAGVLANDTDADGDALSAAIVTAPAHGTLTLAPSGSFLYTPAANWNGADRFTYTASDGHGGTSTATAAITVTPVNDAPVASAVSTTTAEDAPLEVAFAATDVDGDVLTFAVTTPPAHGTLGAISGGKVAYTPNANWSGADSFSYAASDGTSESAPAVAITVPRSDARGSAGPRSVGDPTAASAHAVVAHGDPVNDAPVASASPRRPPRTPGTGHPARDRRRRRRAHLCGDDPTGPRHRVPSPAGRSPTRLPPTGTAPTGSPTRRATAHRNLARHRRDHRDRGQRRPGGPGDAYSTAEDTALTIAAPACSATTSTPTATCSPPRSSPARPTARSRSHRPARSSTRRRPTGTAPTASPTPRPTATAGPRPRRSRSR